MVVMRYGIRLQQIPEQSAVVHHCLAQIFRGRLARRMLDSYFPGRTVVHDDVRVIDRNVGDALLELPDRIAACGHQLADEPVRFGDRPARIVNKARLNAAPRIVVSLGVSRAEWMDVQLGHALCTGLERCLGFSDVALLPDGAVVLSTEPLTQLLAPHAVHSDPYDGADQHQGDEHPYDW